jgi:hypothetical protein
MLPAFDEFGNLPQGIHRATIEEVVQRFGAGSPEREVEEQELLLFTGWARRAGVRRLVVNGSFVTAKTAQRGRRGDPMTPRLTPGGYAQTRSKLEDLERRLAELESRTDLKPLHRAEVRRSYESMIRQYRREMKLHEAERCQESEKE